MADHEHGSMNIDEQEKTFAGFMSFTTRSVIVIIIALIVIAILGA
jgi:flagellar biogenesis protein FliO